MEQSEDDNTGNKKNSVYDADFELHPVECGTFPYYNNQQAD